MKKLKTRTIWFITIGLFIFTIGLVIAVPFTSDILNKIVVVGIVVCFIILTFLVQYASFRTFQHKHKIKYKEKEYLFNGDLTNVLKDKGFKIRKTNYGDSYLLISNKVAYKVVLVYDIEKYFEPLEEKNTPKNKELDNCKSFIAFEIFFEMNDEVKRKIVEFSIQGEKVYYTAFSKTDSGFYCYNYLKPEGIHEADYNELLKLLEFKEKEAV